MNPIKTRRPAGVESASTYKARLLALARPLCTRVLPSATTRTASRSFGSSRMSAQAARVLPQGAWLGLHLKRTGGPQASFTKRSIFNIPYLSSDGEQQLLGGGDL